MKAVVESPDKLTWTVKRLWVVQQPMTPAETMDAAMVRGGPYRGLGGAPGRFGISQSGAGLGLIVDTIVCLALLPFLPLAILLRRVGWLSWTIQARCRPWGRQGPPTMMRWKVKGEDQSRRAFQDIVAALEHGSGAPEVAGVERVR